MLDAVLSVMVSMLSRPLPGRPSSMLLYLQRSELMELSNVLTLASELPLLTQTLSVSRELTDLLRQGGLRMKPFRSSYHSRHASRHSSGGGSNRDLARNDSIRRLAHSRQDSHDSTASGGAVDSARSLKHPYQDIITAHSAISVPAVAGKLESPADHEHVDRLAMFRNFLHEVSHANTWENARAADFERLVQSLLSIQALVHPPPTVATGVSSIMHMATGLHHHSGGGGHGGGSLWAAEGITAHSFQHLVKHLVHYATNVGTTDEAGLLLILKVIQDLLKKADANHLRDALYMAQCEMERLGAVHMVYTQLCHPRPSYQDEVAREVRISWLW